MEPVDSDVSRVNSEEHVQKNDLRLGQGGPFFRLLRRLLVFCRTDVRPNDRLVLCENFLSTHRQSENPMAELELVIGLSSPLPSLNVHPNAL